MATIVAPPTHPSGRELAYAEATVSQTSAVGTQTNITGLEITFTVTDRPVYVVGYTPWVSGTAASSVSLVIRDGSDTDKQVAAAALAGTTSIVNVTVHERITTPGSYTRRLSFARATGTGTLTHLAGLASVKATLAAIER